MYVCTYFSHNTTSAHQANRQWQYIGIMVTASQTLPRILAPEQTETIETNKLLMTPT